MQRETKYTEIFRLKGMLDEAGIEYEFSDNSFAIASYKHEHYQIQVFNPTNKDERIISVIEGDGSYGGKSNLLEIMGCLTDEEAEHDCVCGWLTAENVFKRIVKAVQK